jgi:hypothetical protein
MRTDRAARAILLLAIGIAAVLLPSVRAEAQPKADADAPIAADAPASDASKEAPGWEPRFGLGFGVLSQAQKGKAIVPTEADRAEVEDDGDSLVTQHFSFGLDLLTPVELPVVTRPRLLLTSSFQAPISRGLIANRVDLQFDGGANPDPGFSENCPSQVGSLNTTTCSIRVRSKTSIDYLWSAGLGVDFTLPIDQDQFHFTQGFEYIGMAAQAEGRYQRRTAATLGSAQDSETEFIDAKGDLELYHGISITETFSVDAHQEGPLKFGFFIQGRMSWFDTDRDMSVSERSDRGRFVFVTSLNDPEPIQFQVLGGVTVRFDPRLR